MSLYRNIPSFPGQQLAQFKLLGTSNVSSTTVTTGAVALALAIDPTSFVQNWADRFQDLFEEYRVIKAVLKINCFSSTNPGVINAWVDEVASTAPTATAASERTVLKFSAANVEKTHILHWKPVSLPDLAYTPVATALNPAWFKIYTDNSSFGSSIVATQYFTSIMEFVVQFRGFVTN